MQLLQTETQEDCTHEGGRLWTIPSTSHGSTAPSKKLSVEDNNRQILDHPVLIMRKLLGWSTIEKDCREV